MSATRKKVIVRLFPGGLHWGYLPASGLGDEGDLELLLPDGHVRMLAWGDVKHVAYVKDFNLHDTQDPEKIGPRSFSSKPRGGGVWVRVRLVDEETLEGLMHAGLALLDSLLADRGLFLDPPDKRGNTQRLFIPRSALIDFEILGVAGAVSADRRRAALPSQRQGDLFTGSGEG